MEPSCSGEGRLFIGKIIIKIRCIDVELDVHL